jgi:membrane-bound lytic murein transglycosylase F
LRTRQLILSLIVSLISFSCSYDTKSSDKDLIISRDLDQIRERGKLVAITDFNSTSYFVYRGEPMGYQYELLQAYADYIDLELILVTENDLNIAFEMLDRGDADLIALNLSINRERRERVAFTHPIGQTRQVLVQRRPEEWLSMTMDDVDRMVVRNQLDLAGKTVYVQSGTAYLQRLKNLQDEIGDSINIIEVPMETEEIVTLVAKGEIDYTVTDENVARVNSTYYSILDVETPLSFPQNYGWGVRKRGSHDLLTSLNEWIEVYKNTTSYALLYAKYFKNSRSKRIVESDFYTLTSGKVSNWDDYFISYSDSIDWDWRLLASVACQESRFDSEAVSWAGAYGIMQLMPSTGDFFGIDITRSPEDNINAGVKYLKWLAEIFQDKVPDENERIKFILASYNVGPGHVLDARQLAVKNGKDPDIWDDNVAYYLLMKSDPDFYRDPVVEHGFCRGEEPFNYVIEILQRYDHYQNIVPIK